MSVPSPTIFNPKANKESPEGIVIPTIAEILLITAAVLWLLFYLKLPIEQATGAMLIVLLFGSFICWKSPLAAEAVMYLSLFLSEYVLVVYQSGLLIPCILVDVFVVLAMTLLRQSPEE
jgi:hypothetical protein